LRFPEDWGAEIPARFEGLIFDCDGTLVDTMPAHYLAWREVFAPYAIEFSLERFHALAGVPSIAIIATLANEQGKVVDPRAIALEKDASYLALDSHGPPIAPVAAIARREHGRRRLGVASGNVTSLVRVTLREAGLEALFDSVVGADRVERGKPAPDVFLLAAKELGVSPERCVAYEDGDLGLVAARDAGMTAIDVRPWLLHPSS
jgi:HAD superfamily hydrolase (TIGR01509 family)